MSKDFEIQSRILYKVAQANGNPRAYLDDILQNRTTRIVAGNGRVIISSSTGGSSASWTLPEGFNDQEVMQIAYMALQLFMTNVNNTDRGNTPGFSPISQVENADRKISYPSFRGIQL